MRTTWLKKKKKKKKNLKGRAVIYAKNFVAQWAPLSVLNGDV